MIPNTNADIPSHALRQIIRLERERDELKKQIEALEAECSARGKALLANELEAHRLQKAVNDLASLVATLNGIIDRVFHRTGGDGL